VTLFDLIDVLVADYAKEHHLLTVGEELSSIGIGYRALAKIGISESTRQFWRKRVIHRYANSVVDQTVALPIKIPEILITGLVTAYVVTKFNENNTKEQIEVATSRENAKTVESQKEELQKLILLLNEYNAAFYSDEHGINPEGGLPDMSKNSWKNYREKYVDLGKTFAKFSSSSTRLSMDTTTKLVIDTFIKQIDKQTDISRSSLQFQPTQKEDANKPEFVARKLLLSSLLLGESPSKSDADVSLPSHPPDDLGNTQDYASFNRAFLAESKRIAELLQTTLDNIVIAK
jgi:hypothetical protein